LSFSIGSGVSPGAGSGTCSSRVRPALVESQYPIRTAARSGWPTRSLGFWASRGPLAAGEGLMRPIRRVSRCPHLPLRCLLAAVRRLLMGPGMVPGPRRRPGLLAGGRHALQPVRGIARGSRLLGLRHSRLLPLPAHPSGPGTGADGGAPLGLVRTGPLPSHPDGCRTAPDRTAPRSAWAVGRDPAFPGSDRRLASHPGGTRHCRAGEAAWPCSLRARSGSPPGWPWPRPWRSP
jgi:hypothetical protein